MERPSTQQDRYRPRNQLPDRPMTQENGSRGRARGEPRGESRGESRPVTPGEPGESYWDPLQERWLTHPTGVDSAVDQLMEQMIQQEMEKERLARKKEFEEAFEAWQWRVGNIFDKMEKSAAEAEAEEDAMMGVRRKQARCSCTERPRRDGSLPAGAPLSHTHTVAPMRRGSLPRSESGGKLSRRRPRRSSALSMKPTQRRTRAWRRRAKGCRWAGELHHVGIACWPDALISHLVASHLSQLTTCSTCASASAAASAAASAFTSTTATATATASTSCLSPRAASYLPPLHPTGGDGVHARSARLRRAGQLRGARRRTQVHGEVPRYAEPVGSRGARLPVTTAGFIPESSGAAAAAPSSARLLSGAPSRQPVHPLVLRSRTRCLRQG